MVYVHLPVSCNNFSMYIAFQAYKSFEIPTELFFLWRYLKNVYETQAMNATCPADREIITYYQLKASCPPHLSKAQSLLGDERTFSCPERSLYLNGEFEDLLWDLRQRSDFYWVFRVTVGAFQVSYGSGTPSQSKDKKYFALFYFSVRFSKS